jgi:hypothetical protein
MSPAKKAAKKPSPAKKAAPKKPAAKAKPVPKPVATPKPVAKKAAAPPAKEKPVKKAAAPAAAPAAKKGAPPVAAKPEAAPKGPAPKAAPAKKAGKPKPRAPVLPDLVKPGLGGRWECYSCGSKFYDLGRPEPTCPKCGADQRDKPRETTKPSPTPPAERQRRAAVPMGSLLDDEEGEPAEDYEGDEEDIGAIDDDSFLTETTEVADDEDDVDVGAIEDD